MADASDDRVKGTAEMTKQAAAGLALLQSDEAEIEGDVAAATKYKDDVDAQHAALEAEVAALTGKDNKKARTEKSKEASALKKTNEYIDAERVVKGMPPKHGHFVKAGTQKGALAKNVSAPAAAPAVEEKKDEKKKDEKKPKKTESAGISPAERQELEKLKTDIVARKATLKEGGMSGGQINKDSEIVAWVARMNELKEKECPGSTTAGKDDKKKDAKKKVLSGDAAKQVVEVEKEIEEYRSKLKNEFGYTNKDINADPDMMDLLAKLKAMKK